MLSGNTVKYIQSLTHKKFRDQYNQFIAETPKVVGEFLTAGYKADAIYVTEEWVKSYRGKLPVNQQNIVVVKDFELEKISQLKTAREVVAVLQIPEEKFPESLAGQVSLVLDDIQDPGNVGTIIRIADWFGIRHVMCSLHTAHAFSPKVVQATMGSLAHIEIHYLDLEIFLRNCKLPIYATSLNGTSVFSSQKIDEGVLVIGNEGKGVSENILALASHLLTIPRIGKAESLNAAMATGIILSHIVKF